MFPRNGTDQFSILEARTIDDIVKYKIFERFHSFTNNRYKKVEICFYY